MSKILVKCIKRGSDGQVDMQRTKESYESALLEDFAKAMTLAEQKLQKAYEEGRSSFDADLAAYLSQRAEWDVLSKTYIDRAFDRFSNSAKGGCITKPTLINLCITSMAHDKVIDMSQLPKAREMVAAFITDNTDSLYTVEKGIDGGVRRIPVPTVES